MSRGLRMHASIFFAALLGERRQLVVGWTVTALLACVAGAGLVAMAKGSAQAILTGILVPLMALAAFLWLRYVPGAVRQNSPANARLVPHLHALVRRTAIGAWCAAMLPFVLYAAVADNGVPVLLGAAVAMTALGMSRGGHASGTAIYILLIVGATFGPANTVLASWLASPAVLAAMGGACLLFAWFALGKTFPAGGEGHFRLLKQQGRQQAGTALADLQKLRLSSGKAERLYGMMLRHDLCKARRENLLMHALGPSNHRFDFLAPLVVALAVILFAKAGLSQLEFLPQGYIPQGILILASLGVLAQGITFHRFVASFTPTRGEQSLVRLTPAAPAAPVLGAVVARQLLRMALGEWAVFNVFVIAALLLFSGGWHEVQMVASMAAASLAMTGWALRDYAAAEGGSLVEVAVQCLLMGTGTVALFLVRGDLPMWSMLMLLLLGCSFAIVSGRLKAMAAAPVPFPAGRLA